MEPRFERSVLGAQRVLVVPGRLRRLSLPLREAPIAERGRCFLCRNDDPLLRGPLEDAAPWWVWGNAFPVAADASILAVPGEEGHPGTLADLGETVWAAIFARVLDPRLARPAELGTQGQRRVFANQGRIAGQTRRHPHLQWFRHVGVSPNGDEAAAVEDDRALADAQGRAILRDAAGAAVAWVPCRPAQSAELWLRPSAAEFPRRLVQCLRAGERAISESYNVVVLPELDLLRLVPRGLGERAGLELALVGHLDGVVVSTPAEAAELWREALGSS